MTLETDIPKKPFEDDPALGEFVSYHPVDRLRLLIIGGGAYALVVIFVQLFFFQLDDETAAIIQPALYALASLAIAWYLLHLWNREITIYDQGFTYREGSHTARIFFMEVVTVRLKAERIFYFGLIPRDVYRYTLITQEDETLTIDNRYKKVEKLGLALEKAIAQARLPIVEDKIERGDVIEFGLSLALDQRGIDHDRQRLSWADYAGFKTQTGDLVIMQRNQDPHAHDEWARVKLNALDNAVLLIDLLKRRNQ